MDAVKNVPKQRGRPFAPATPENAAGRPRGARKRSLANIEAAQSGGPLDFLLATMRDQTLPLERRIDAAKAAAPYVHPRLATAERSEMAVPIIIQISANEALL